MTLDVKTRWGSTYKMLDCCNEYKDAFGYYSEVDNMYVWKPSESHWQLYDKIRPILKTMAGATTAFSTSTVCQCVYIIQVKIALKEAQRSGDGYVMSMAEQC